MNALEMLAIAIALHGLGLLAVVVVIAVYVKTGRDVMQQLDNLRSVVNDAKAAEASAIESLDRMKREGDQLAVRAVELAAKVDDLTGKLATVSEQLKSGVDPNAVAAEADELAGILRASSDALKAAVAAAAPAPAPSA
jgi:hypothetical protein